MKITFLSISLLFICSGITAQTEEWRHSDTLGGIYGALNIYIDVNANLYVGGPAIDSLDIYGVPSAALVFKLDSGGHYHWNQGFIYDNNVEYFGMAGDNAGNNYLYGEYNGGKNFNAYMAKVDSSGNLDWVNQFDYEGYFNAYNNAMVDKNGNILVAGTSTDTFGNQDMTSLKFSPADSAPLWNKRDLQTNSFYNSYFAQTDNDGGLYNLGQAQVTNLGGNSIILLKYDSTGAYHWIKIINSTAYSDEEPASTNADSSGNLYIADNSSPDIDNANYVPFLLKINKSGTAVWQELFGDTTNNYNLTSSALDTSYFYIGGAINDQIYMAKLSAATGDTVWTFVYDSGTINKMILKNGAIYVTGSINNIYGSSSFFTAKISATGQMLWSATYDDAQHGYDQAFDLAADNAGNIYVAGQSFETSVGDGSATVIKYHDNGIIIPTCQLVITSVSITDINTCYGATNGAITINSTGGIGPVSYSIDSGIDFQQSNVFAGLAASIHYVEVKDTNHCMALYSGNPVSITQPAADTPTIKISGDTLSTGTFTKYQWYFNGGVVDTNQFLVISDHSFCGAIYVEVVDGNGCTFNSSAIDNICLGISSLNNPAGLSIYPNPFGEYFNVKLDDWPASGVQAELFDLCGQKIYDDKPASNAFSIPTSTLAQGVYLLRLKAGEQFLYRQVVKAGNE